MKRPSSVLLLSTIALFVMSGCLGGNGAEQTHPVRGSDEPIAFELGYGDEGGPISVFTLSPGDDDTMNQIQQATDAYNQALQGAVMGRGENASTFEDHAEKFRSVAGALEDEKNNLLAELESAKNRLGLYPTWRELDFASQQVARHHQGVLDTVGREIQHTYQTEIEVMNEERRSLAMQMVLYAVLAVPVVAGTSWGITRWWEAKQEYWGSFTSQNLFLDPRLPMVVGAGIALLVALTAILVLPSGRDLFLYLMPW